MLHYTAVTFNTIICHIQLWVSICNKQEVDVGGGGGGGGGCGTGGGEARTPDFTNVHSQYHPKNNVSCT
jgi:hypothetical protein